MHLPTTEHLRSQWVALQPVRRNPWEAVKELLGSKQFWITLIALSVLTQLLAESRLADGLNNAGLDAALVFANPPTTLKDVIVVEIDQPTFEHNFNSHLPADIVTLRRLLELLETGHPTAIAVDLELTKPIDFASHPSSLAFSAPIIWSTGLRWDEAHPNYLPAFNGTIFGVARVLRGRDGIVRRYSPETSVDGSTYPTLVGAVLGQVCEPSTRYSPTWKGCREHNDGPSLIRFVSDTQQIPHLPAGTLLDMSAAEAAQAADVLRGKIVVLGGTFAESRDIHITPTGIQPGVYIQAQAVATAIQGGGLHEPNAGLLFAEKVFAGVIVGILAAVLSSRWTVYLHLLIVPVSSLFIAIVAFKADYWVSFVPVLMSGFIHQWYHDLGPASRRTPSGHQETPAQLTAPASASRPYPAAH